MTLEGRFSHGGNVKTFVAAFAVCFMNYCAISKPGMALWLLQPFVQEFTFSRHLELAMIKVTGDRRLIMRCYDFLFSEFLAQNIHTLVKELRSELFCHLPVQCQLGMFDIQATIKSKYYNHIVLLYLEFRRCRYRSIIFACFYIYITVVIFIDYSDIDKMMDINNEKC